MCCSGDDQTLLSSRTSFAVSTDHFAVSTASHTSPVLRNVPEVLCITLQCLPVATHQQCCAITRKCSAGAAKCSPATVYDCQWHPPGPLPAATPRELLAIAEAEIKCALPGTLHRYGVSNHS